MNATVKGFRHSKPSRDPRPGMRWALVRVSRHKARTNNLDPFGDSPENTRGRCVLEKDTDIVRWRYKEVPK